MRQSQRTSSRCVVVVAFALVAVLATSGTATAAAQVSQEQGISGVVKDTQGLPLLGAFVAAIPLGADQPEGIAVTDARGQFRFPGLPEGMYTLLVGSLGFAGTVIQGINAPALTPVAVQLQARDDRELATVEAPLELGWALRSGNRDVLRQTDATLVADTGEVGGSTGSFWAPATDAGLGNDSVAGELRLWSVTSTGERETVGVTSLSLGTRGIRDSWNLKAHVGDRGAVWANSSFVRDVGDGHEVRVGFDYVGGNFHPFPGLADEHDSWTGRLTVRDTWQVRDALELTLGAAYEYQNYLAAGGMVSPEVEVTYRPFRGTRLFTGASRSSRGLELTTAEKGFEVVSLLGHSNLTIEEVDGVRPERATRIHFGLEQELGDAQVRVKAYYDDVTDELLGLYVAGPDGVNNYLLFNVGDSAARGFELAVSGRFSDRVSGEFSYVYRDRERNHRVPGLSGTGLEADTASTMDWTLDDTHELAASVTAQVEPLQTHVFAVYNWRYGLPVVKDGEIRDAFGRIDLRLRQPLPFRALDSNWSAMVQIRNILGPEYQGLYNVSLAELLGLTRGFAGGLAVKF